MLEFIDVMENISKELTNIPLEQVVEIHNKICYEKIELVEDGKFEYLDKNIN